MLAQQRWRCSDAGLAFGILYGRVDHLYWPAGVMLHLHHHVTRLGVFVIQSGLDVVDGGVGHALAFKHLQPRLCGLGL